MNERDLKDKIKVKNALKNLSIVSGETSRPITNTIQQKQFEFLKK